MRTTLPLAAALAALLAAPAPARAAGGYVLRAGAEYQQSDTWAVSGERSSIPRLDVDLGLNAGGSLGGPGLVDWNTDAQYRRTAVNGDDAVQDRISYGLRSTFFSAPASPAFLSVFASRRDESYSTEGAAAGSVEGNSFGGGLTLRGSGSHPFLSGTYAYAKDDLDSIALGRSSRALQVVQATTGFGASAFSYQASYRGNFSDGTFETDRFADHRIDANADATLAPATRLRLSTLYFTRDTSTLSAISARQEAESVTASVLRTPADGLQQTGGYAYSRGTQVTAASDVERIQHSLNYSAGGQLPAPEWSLRVGGNATFDEDRLGAAVSRSASQSLSAFLAWRRSQAGSSVELHGGPSVGALEPDSGAARFGYGATAGVSHSRSASVQTSFGYDATFNSNISDEGWSLVQSANGSALMRLGLASLQGSLQLSDERRQTPLFGASGSRALTALGAWRLRVTDVTLQLGYQDGTSGRLPSGSDGLFIAPNYDSRTAYAQLSAGTTFARFNGRLRARFSSTDLPDRPAFNETQLAGSLDYAYGALRIAVEDTYVVTEVFGGQHRVNQLMVRAYRVFGSRF